MKKILSLALVSLALAAAVGSVGARPAAPSAPAFQLGTPSYSGAYCQRLALRCDQGDANACKLYAQGCGL